MNTRVTADNPCEDNKNSEPSRKKSVVASDCCTMNKRTGQLSCSCYGNMHDNMLRRDGRWQEAKEAVKLGTWVVLFGLKNVEGKTSPT